MKKISIIIPCYNVEDYIDRCINSLIQQTIGIDNLEIILVNDASTDQTLVRLLEYEKQFPESILVINCEKNGRQGTARNIGLTYASADSIAFFDADDWCEPDMYERMYENAIKYNADVVRCKLLRDDGTAIPSRHPENNRLITIQTAQDTSDAIEHPEAWGGNGVICLCKKSLLIDNEIYFPENTSYEDMLWNRLLMVYERSVYTMDEELYHYFINPQSTVLTRNTNRQLEMLDAALLTWEEYNRRGLLELYKDAIEMDFIKSFYMYGLRILAYRFDEPDYQVFLYMIDVMHQLVPDWKNNKYIHHMAPFFRSLLNITDLNPSEEDFNNVMQIIRESKI